MITDFLAMVKWCFIVCSVTVRVFLFYFNLTSFQYFVFFVFAFYFFFFYAFLLYSVYDFIINKQIARPTPPFRLSAKR